MEVWASGISARRLDLTLLLGLSTLLLESNRFRLIEWNKLVDQPRDLTDRIWNTLKPQLVQCVDLGILVARQASAPP